MRVLPVVLAFSLLSQYAVVVTAQVVLRCQTAPVGAAHGDEATCRCLHGRNAVCPIHDRAGARLTSGAAQPHWCAEHTEQAPIVLTSVSEDIGTPPREPFRVMAPPLPSIAVLDHTMLPLDGTSPPTLPPPRS